MIISLDAKMVFDKIKHLFMLKVLEKSGIRGIIKAKYSKPKANTNYMEPNLNQVH